MLYTLNLYSIVCQLHLNKTVRKKRIKATGEWIINLLPAIAQVKTSSLPVWDMIFQVST